MPFAAIASVAFALLVDEILLSAIFHVLVGGGNTVAAISVALLGLSAAGIVAYLVPALRDPERAGPLAAVLLVGFGATLMLCTVAVMSVPLNHADLVFARGELRVQLLRVGVYVAAALPFFAGGLAINVVLRAHAERVSRLYFSDLAGAACGCVAAPLLLATVGAPLGILLAAVPAVLVAAGPLLRAGGWPRAVLVLPALLVVAASVDPSLLRFRQLNTMGEVTAPRYRSVELGREDLDYERWALDAWTVVRAESIPQQWENFRGWGVSDRYAGPVPPITLVNYNARFSTYVTQSVGSLEPLGPWLDSDLISIHFLLGRHYDSVLNIGAGGGREVLNALHHGASRVVAVDLSEAVVEDLMKDRLRDYSGGLYLDPRVEAVADEGRTFVERSDERFDLIDMSIVGGTSLEKMDLIRSDDLFTLEALRSYFAHLEDAGVFSYVMYTLRSDLVAALAAEPVVTDPPYVPALKTLVGLRTVLEEQVPGADFRDHVLIAGLPRRIDPNFDLVHITASRTAFTEAERRAFVARCEALDFPIFHPVEPEAANPYARVAVAPDLSELVDALPFSIRPSRDDLPFQFAFDRAHLARAWEHGRLGAFLAANPVISLGLPIALLALLLVATPLLWMVIVDGQSVAPVVQRFDLLAYFGCIGFAFMAVEIPILFKLQLYLGKPIYGLAVGLFAFLFSGGLGSAFTERFDGASLRPFGLGVVCLLAAGALFYLVSSAAFMATIAWPLAARATIAVVSIFPVAFVMGGFFPMGIKLVSRSQADLIPWAWAINGATSVLGILGSRAIALFLGFDRTLVVGLVAYLGVLVCIGAFARSTRSPMQPIRS